LTPLFLSADFSLQTKALGETDQRLILDLNLYAFAPNQESELAKTQFVTPPLKNINLNLSKDPFTSSTIQRDVSTTNLLNLNFQDIAVRSALQRIAEFAKVNIIVSDKVQGNVSLHLHQVTWQEALKIICQTQGLGQRNIGNSILVAPLSELLTYDKQQLQIQDDLKNSQPLKTNTFQLKYGKAQAYYDTFKNSTNTLLSPRGKVVVNPRTNFLLVEDLSDNLKRIRQYIEQTDVALRQVEIEARIVTIDKSYEQQLGIKWNVQAAPVTTAQGSGGRGFNLDLGAGAIDGTKPGSIALATLANDVLIGLELSALEAEGNGEVLSSPRLLTADQQEAIIEQGQEIPYQENAGGATGATTTSFKQAVLRLKVTPQIISDNKLLLRLEVNQDAKSRDTSKDGIPLIDTRHISTNILINNGETVVLGGIYERNKSDSITRIPFISDVPLIGNLFKHRRISDQRNELLIFVTPRIVSQ
jgi:type IV pilus assembly protein PilQ